MFLFKNNVDLLIECGFSKNDVKRLYEELVKMLNEQNEDYLDYIKGQEKSVIVRILSNK